MSTISERLQGLLDDNNYKPSYLAKKTGVSPSVISRILKKNSTPQDDNLKKLAEFLHVGEDWMLTGAQENDTETQQAQTSYDAREFFFLDGVEYKRLTNEEKVDVLLAQNSRLMGMLETQISSINILVRSYDGGSVLKKEQGAAFSQ